MELQIIRTRHPPEAHLSQLMDLVRHSGPISGLEDVRRRLQLIPETDRFLLATDVETLIGYAHTAVQRPDPS